MSDSKKYYVNDPEYGLVFYPSQEEARGAAYDLLEDYTTRARYSGVWVTGVAKLEWGKLIPYESAIPTSAAGHTWRLACVKMG